MKFVLAPDSFKELMTGHEAVDVMERPITSECGYVAEGGLAIIEVATAAGIDLVAPSERNRLSRRRAASGRSFSTLSTAARVGLSSAWVDR
jgi:glycerate kinase